MLTLWIGFFIIVAVLLIVDLAVFHRRAHEIKLKEAAGWSVVWIAVGIAFSAVVYFIYEYHWFGAALRHDPGEGLMGDGNGAALKYLTGYILEKALSVDNIFVMSMIFTSFRVAPRFQHRVLFWGIVGAIVARGGMIFGGVWLTERFTWTFYIFGGYLAYAGVKMLIEKEGHNDPAQGPVVKIVRRIIPVTMDDHGQHLIAKEGKRTALTRLGLALVAIETTDVVFALDSVPAVLGITNDSFIVMTSNIFAILGLRALYFVVADLLGRFSALKPTLSALLVFIGAKMLLHSVVKIPTVISLGAILLILTVGLFASIVQTRLKSRRES